MFLPQFDVFLLQYLKWPFEEIMRHLASPISSSYNECTVEM